MASGYLLILLFFLGALAFVGVGLLASWLLQTRKPNPQKLAPYECGEEPTPIVNTMNFRYYMPALIFLLFEVEIVLMTPILLTQKNLPEGWSATEWFSLVRIEALLFFVLLTLAFAVAWALGYLDWEKPKVEPIVFEGAVPDFAYEQYNLDQIRKS